MRRRGWLAPAALGAWIGASCVASPHLAVAAGYREGNDAPAARIARAAVCTFPEREDRALSPADGAFQLLVAGPGNVGLTVSNFGSVGNDADTRAASFEFPNGSEIEHLIRGGLWIGALSTGTGDTLVLVSTGSISQNISGSSDGTTEFVPLGRFARRSTLPNDPNYSPDAISEEDLTATFRDFPAPDRSGEEPCPLGVEVTLTVLGWSFKPVDDFLILSYTIKNVSKEDLKDVYIGMFGEFASNFKGRYENWPPGGAIFRNKVITWEDSSRLFTEHHCSFDRGAAPTWGGLKVLGSEPETIDGKVVAFNWFDFSSRDIPDLDRERYQVMANGNNDSTDMMTSSCTAGGAGNDPIEVISFGPYSDLVRDESLTVAFAFVGGENLSDLQLNAAWAQRAFDANYIIPQPPPSPSVFLDPGPNELTIFWDAVPETIPDPASGLIDFEGYRVHLSTDNLGFEVVRDVDILDSVGFNTGFSGVRADTFLVVDGDTANYNYRVTLPGLRDGFRYWASVTSYDVGDPTQGLPPLESGVPQNKTQFVPGGDPSVDGPSKKVTVYPNPYRGQAAWDGNLPREKLLWFNHLPSRCVIRIYTLAGDLVKEIPFEGSTYRASGVFLLDRPDEDPPVLSGGQAAWDLITKEDQPAASGLYIFAVEDLASGDVETGKFLILK